MAYIGSTTWYQQVKMGLVPGYSIVSKFGANSAVSTTYTTLTASGIYNMPTSATALEFVSSSASDTSAGAGAREVTIVGLDSNWAEVTQTVATNGTTAVALGTNLIRLYRWYVSPSGTYPTTMAATSHVGTLTIRVAGAGATWSTIGLTNSIGRGQSQIGAYTVPTGKTGYIILKQAHVDSTKSADIVLWQRPNANDVTTPYSGAFRIVEEELGVTSQSAYDPKSSHGPFVGPCDLLFQAKGASSPGVSVDFEILLVG